MKSLPEIEGSRCPASGNLVGTRIIDHGIDRVAVWDTTCPECGLHVRVTAANHIFVHDRQVTT